MLKVMTIGSELESVRRLGLPTYIGEVPDYFEDTGKDIWVRFGNSRSVFNKKDEKREFPHVLQTAKAIRANCEKFESRKKLLKSKISCPEVYVGSVPSGEYICRELEHSSGKNFKKISGPCEIPEGYYASPYIKTRKEVRIWFCGKAMLMARRVPLKDVDDTETNGVPCRSSWGYNFCYSQVPSDIYQSCSLAAKTLNLKFGAFDILLYANKHFILEGNSSPTIDLVRLERFYKENLLKLLKEEFKENFDKLAERKKLEKEGYKFFNLD